MMFLTWDSSLWGKECGGAWESEPGRGHLQWRVSERWAAPMGNWSLTPGRNSRKWIEHRPRSYCSEGWSRKVFIRIKFHQSWLRAAPEEGSHLISRHFSLQCGQTKRPPMVSKKAPRQELQVLAAEIQPGAQWRL